MPKGMSVEAFKKSLESVENKERFLEHLETRKNPDERLAALNLVEPILREPHIEIFTKDNAIEKKEYIKAFKDDTKVHLYMLITQDNDKILKTFIPNTPERYVRNHVRNADIIHSFIQPNRTAKSDNALSDVVVYGENTTKKPLTSQAPKSVIEQASEEIRGKAFDFSNEKLTNEQIKKLLNNAKIPTSGRDAVIFGKNNLTPEIVEFMHKNNKKMIIEKVSNKELELLQDANFKHPENIRASLDHDAITHILKRHGVNSANVRNGEIPITNDDIANYRDIINNADAIIRTIDKHDKEAIEAFKQVNGYAVVVEQAINKKNELVLKTMYKSNGSYKNNETYKEFSSTSLNANAKVHHRLSSYSGATENTTKKPNKSRGFIKNPRKFKRKRLKFARFKPIRTSQRRKACQIRKQAVRKRKRVFES
ncbi:hypothetical protein Kyoto4A_14600 [Helicobacter pylori]